MLVRLRITNFAIIDSVVLPLGPGLNVLSGETGAGKSIIVGALGLLTGERASADVVRTGADKAVVEGEFDASACRAAREALDAHGLDAEGLVVLRREVGANGRGRAWVNGTAVAAGMLATIGRLLVNIHGQHDAQALLDESSQREMLDRFAGATDIAHAVAQAHAELARTSDALRERITRRDDAARRADYLRHVADEVAAARLKEGEEEELASEAARLTHAEELRTLAAGLAEALTGDDAAAGPVLGRQQRALAAMTRLDPGAGRLQELLDAAYYAVDELAREVGAYADGISHDPERLADVERRRDVIHRIVRKHGGTVASALEAGRAARAELDALDTAAHDVAELERAVAEAGDALARSARALTAKRKAAAERLAREVEAALPALGMPDGRFTVSLVPLPAIGATGAEAVEYRVTLNLGHDARPLARVASGGELSRVMLALKTILADVDEVPTLVFDEVDAGIGGAVGTMVGDAMRAVAARHQVFAITHLAQIAARAEHHVVVTKAARGGVTSADVRVVAEGDRVSEVARMLGGEAESQASQAHARELIDAARPARSAGRRARR